MTASKTIDQTLSERGSRYGVFSSQAKISQDIKRAMVQGNWSRLADDQKECLEMFGHKIARILNGDPNYHDSWHDLGGYAKLVADRLSPCTEEDSSGKVPDWISSEVKDTYEAMQGAGQNEAYRIMERMVRRIGYCDLRDPSLAPNGK